MFRKMFREAEPAKIEETHECQHERQKKTVPQLRSHR
jgi:hypothetical protein